MRISALKGKVIVSDLERGDRIVMGIIIPNDNGKNEGIRPRWGKVYSVGKDITDIKVGQWILIENMRWTRSVKITDDNDKDINLWQIEWPQGAMLVSDEDPDTGIFSKWI